MSSSTIFLIGPGFHRIGINQAVWEPATNTLHVESDEQLKQSSTYLLVVTEGIRDAAGKRLDGSKFLDDLTAHTKDPAVKVYRALLFAGLFVARVAGVKDQRDRDCEPVHDADDHRDVEEDPRAAQGGDACCPSFTLGSAGERTVFPLSTIHRDPVGPADRHRAELRKLVPAGARALGVPWLGRDRRVRLVLLARLRDGRQGDPGDRDAEGHARRAGHEQDRLHAVRPVGHEARRRLAGRDLRARLRRQPRRRSAGWSRPRSRARVSRRSRSTSSATGAVRSGRTPSCGPAEPARHALRRRPRVRPERQRHHRLDGRRERGRRYRRSSATATACDRP